MNITVKGRHHDVPADVRDYAEAKIGKVDKILNSFVKDAEVELFSERNPAIENNKVAEITVFTKGPVIRARESAKSYLAAIDLASDKIESQARKVHGKFVGKRKHTPPLDQVVEAPPVPGELEEMPDEPEGAIVKTKIIEVKPMTQDEAILQLELLNHDFFVFQSAETDELNVLYRRKDGDYGVIATTLA
jgi:putative sigma-54 modulation protein